MYDSTFHLFKVIDNSFNVSMSATMSMRNRLEYQEVWPTQTAHFKAHFGHLGLKCPYSAVVPNERELNWTKFKEPHQWL